MKVFYNTSWDEVYNECRNSDDNFLRDVARLADDAINDSSAVEDLVKADTDCDTFDELVEEYDELKELKKLFFERFKFSDGMTEEQINEQLNGYFSAFGDRVELANTCVENLPFLTNGFSIEDLQHEFSRMKELANEKIKRLTFERDFLKLMLAESIQQ